MYIMSSDFKQNLIGVFTLLYFLLIRVRQNFQTGSSNESELQFSDCKLFDCNHTIYFVGSFSNFALKNDILHVIKMLILNKNELQKWIEIERMYHE